MRRLFPLISLLLLLAAPVNAAHAGPIAPGLAVTVTPTEFIPAQGGMVTVTGGYPLDITMTMDGEPMDVFWSGDAYMAVFSFPFDTSPGPHTITTDVANPLTGETLSQTDTIEVLDFTYQRESIAVSLPLIPLLDPDINQNEADKLEALFSVEGTQSGVDWPLALPFAAPRIQARFGNQRSYNAGVYRGYHDGVDFQSTLGDPIYAAGAGTVINAEMFDVRGNLVIIDHGNGIQSGYAHLSEFNVEVGGYVHKGDLIGRVGSTGRSEGPHLHFMIIIDGNVVDPIRWFELTPGFIAPRELFG